jgi:hypothetical protein
MVGTRALGVDVVDTEQQRFIQRFHRFQSQYAEFVVAFEPVALLSLVAVLTRWMCGVEIPVLRALIVTEVGQQQYTWIGKRFYDLPSHDLLPEFAADVDADSIELVSACAPKCQLLEP